MIGEIQEHFMVIVGLTFYNPLVIKHGWPENRLRSTLGPFPRARGGPAGVWARFGGPARARGARGARGPAEPAEPAESPRRARVRAGCLQMLLRVKAYPLLCVSIFVIGVWKSWPELRR